MPSERIQRQIDRLLDEAEQALVAHDWSLVQTLAREVLSLDPGNEDGAAFLQSAERMLASDLTPGPDPHASPLPILGEGTKERGENDVGARLIAPAPEPDGGAWASPSPRPSPAGEREEVPTPASFVGGRYSAKHFLGAGGKKQVYLAHDELLDRDVAFALVKSEGLDDTGRARIKREAQAMGRLGSHPHIVSVFDMGEEGGQPYIVTELMAGGDVEGLIEHAPEHRPPLGRTLEIGIAVCRGLEFAHSHGIVHRDLKPGNVWLTEDGTAKLGDFGLAVALDRSRLTQAGMMVGTVSYMPPEQALGGEVTPRSDLYSLGAMLYEMVTGRPPFVGDESVAIITQHLNVAPVAPSWHNPAVPPGLEALILRLLEKDANKRPSSAAEVGTMLAGTASPPGPLSSRTGEGEHRGPTPDTRHPTPDTLGANPMYRRTFVGRERELQQLQGAFDAALSGQGGLVMVVGEPGIGKTSIIEQLATYAAIRGGKALVGHCYEEGSLSLPYLPFVEAMRSYVLAREPEGLKSDLGSGAGDVARIVSEVRDRLAVEVRPSGDPEDDRWRLLQAVTSSLRNASLVQPLLLVLEDLHDADRGTLDLLVHLARNLEGARLLIAGTYRDVEVDRQHPLSGTLADLRRINTFQRVPLRGLTADEVQRMMAAAAQREIPWPFAELVHRQTEGNPLFVQEMLRYLVEEGLVGDHGGTLRRVGDDSLAGRIPEGLRDVIGKRLSRLANKTNQVLSVASVIGREFRLDVLQRVVGLPEDDLYTALEEAKTVSIVEERSSAGAVVTYRFTHAFFRQTLYEETIAPRRIRLHQQVARALEAIYGRRLEEHAPELAEHYSYSSDPADLMKSVSYGELAAQRALSVYAYGEAVRHLEQALKVQGVLDPDDKAKRCGLLLALGGAMIPAGEPQKVVSAVAPESMTLAKELGSREQASRACQQALRGILLLQGGPSAYSSDQARTWAEEADHYAAPSSTDRIYADLALASTLANAGLTWGHLPELHHLYERRWELVQRALALAHELGDAEARYRCADPILGGPWLPRRERDRLRAAEEFAGPSAPGVSQNALGVVRAWSFRPLLAWGKRAEAEATLHEAREIAERTRDSSLVIRSLAQEGALALVDGRLEEAVELGRTLAARGEELGAPGLGRVHRRLTVIMPLIHLGRVDETLAELAGAVDTVAGRPWPSFSWGGDVALCLAHLGRWDETRTLLGRIRESYLAVGDDFDSPTSSLTSYLATAVLAGDRELAAVLRDRLADIAGMVGDYYWTCIARHLGAASALLDEWETARAYYEQSIEVCTKVRFRPELALTRLELAELLLANYPDERAAASEHLDFAVAELRDMKMQPALERALRHKEVLKA